MWGDRQSAAFSLGAPIWRKVIEITKYRHILEKAQRGMLLQVVLPNETVVEALQVIAAVTPIDLMVREQVVVYDRRCEDWQ